MTLFCAVQPAELSRSGSVPADARVDPEGAVIAMDTNILIYGSERLTWFSGA
jgi:hypothetical protein